MAGQMKKYVDVKGVIEVRTVYDNPEDDNPEDVNKNPRGM